MAAATPTISDGFYDKNSYSNVSSHENLDELNDTSSSKIVKILDSTAIKNVGKKEELVQTNSSAQFKTNTVIANTWLRITSDLVKESDENWIGKSISKAERYLMALYNDDEYRNFISAYLMIVRNNSDVLIAKPAIRAKLASSLSIYSTSKRSAVDRMKFLRSVRSVGLSPLGR
jgi:hypothetical protein